MPLYHVWFATRSRKWLLQGEIPDAAKDEFDAIAKRQNIKLLEREAIVNHVHMLLDAADKESLSKAMNYLKGASARALFLRYPSIKMDAETNFRFSSEDTAQRSSLRSVNNRSANTSAHNGIVSKTS